MTAFLALLPILVILMLMLGLRWSAALAGSVGMGVSLVVAVAAFAFPVHADPALTVGEALVGTGAEARFTALTILWIGGPSGSPSSTGGWGEGSPSAGWGEVGMPRQR
jgi:lactate permease